MRDPKRRRLMFDYLSKQVYDIASLQGTRILNKRECLQWSAESRCKGLWSVGTIYSGGVGILICDPAKFEAIKFDVDYDGRVCVCDLKFNGTPLRIVNVYVPTVGADRLEFLSNLDRYLLTSRKIIMGGDFNFVLDVAMNRFGGNPSHGSIGSPEMKRLLSRYHLVDIWRKQHPKLKTCTWSNADRSIMSRLDKFYISSELADEWAVSGIHSCHLSDHDLISLTLFDTDHVITWGGGVWKLNTSLLGHAKLRDAIKSFWADWSESKALFQDIGEWWDEGKSEMRNIIIEYSQSVKKKSNEQRAHLTNQFHRLSGKCNLSPEELAQLQLVRTELCDLDCKRFEGVRIRSRVRIIRNQEKPSCFFFRRERSNGSKKLVSALKTDCGWVTDSAAIMQEQVRFYKQLYTSQLLDDRDQEEVLKVIDCRLSEEEKLSLETLLSEGECLLALHAMPANRTPGSDGLPKEFYVCFWDILASDFVAMANYCLDKGELPLSLRWAIITLIFKKDDPENLKNWRPISLLNVDYKLIAKVIAQRLCVVMPSVIHPDQSCAVPGRSSDDNATLLRDISDYVHSNNHQCAFIAIDQEKAFDYVDWKFMHKVLARMNFGPIIRGIIRCLYTHVQSAILSNGTLSEFFDVTRGVRQGCPLSPLLSVLVSECFGQLIRTCSKIRGIKLPGGRECKISQYADDNTCFVTNDCGLLKVLDVFEKYGRASGAKLN